MGEQIRRFREESARLLEEIRDLRDSIDPNTQTIYNLSPSAGSNVLTLPLDHEEIVIE